MTRLFLWYNTDTMRNDKIQRKGIARTISGIFSGVFSSRKKSEKDQISPSNITHKRNDIVERIDKLAGEALRELAKR